MEKGLNEKDQKTTPDTGQNKQVQLHCWRL